MSLLTIGHNRVTFSFKMFSNSFGKGELSLPLRSYRRSLYFANEMIKLLSFDDTPSRLKNMKHHMWFKYCVSAIDCAHISAIILLEKAFSYRSIHGCLFI